MKFSALILLSFLPVAIAQDIAVLVRGSGIPPNQVPVVQAALDSTEALIVQDLTQIVGNSRALAGQDRIDTEMVKGKAVFAPVLPTLTDPDHRALRGQNRELPNCSYCSFYAPPCSVSCLRYMD